MDFERGEFQIPEYKDWLEVEILDGIEVIVERQEKQSKRRIVGFEGNLSRSYDDVVFMEIPTVRNNQEYSEPMF
jgi:hypothetical protein